MKRGVVDLHNVCELSTFYQCWDDIALILVWGIVVVNDVIVVYEDCLINVYFTKSF